MIVFIRKCKELTLVTDELINEVASLPNQYNRRPENNVVFHLLSGLHLIKNDNFFLVLDSLGIYISDDCYHYEDEDCWPELYIKMPEETKFTKNIGGLYGSLVWEASKRTGHFIKSADEEKTFFEERIKEWLEKYQKDFDKIKDSYYEALLIHSQFERISKN